MIHDDGVCNILGNGGMLDEGTLRY